MNNETLAQKIAQLLETERQPADLTDVRESLGAISSRLEMLERKLDGSHAANQPPIPHPSLEKFAIAEAIADKIFAAGTMEKACTFEPNDKPCDHCSMCSARGF